MDGLLKNEFVFGQGEIITAALDTGYLDFLLVMAEGGARLGCIDRMQWFLANECIIDYPLSVYTTAAENGSLKILKWLLENGYYVEDSQLGYIFIAAAEQDNLEIFQWLLDHGCPIDNSDIFVKAARNGNRKVMEWLFKNNCPINDLRVLEEAASDRI